MFSIGYAIYLFVIATWLALLEVQIEGEHGWAAKLPCWRPNPERLVARMYQKTMGGLPLTGYHAVMFSFVFILLHFPFFTSTSWTIAGEMKVCSVYFLLAVNWDFLWFVWNPHYFLRGNTPNSIRNHKTWIFKIFPADYSKGIAVSLFFAISAAAFLKDLTITFQWLRTLGILGVLTLGTCVVQLWRGRV